MQSVDTFAEIKAQLQFASVRNADASDDPIDKTMVPGYLTSGPTLSRAERGNDKDPAEIAIEVMTAFIVVVSSHHLLPHGM